MSYRADLLDAARELREALETAFRLAERTDGFVRLEPALPAGGSRRGRVAPCLPRAFAWGKPPRVPLPPRTLDPRWAEAPRSFTLTPWRTATAGMWFLRHGRRALCVRLSARGELQLLAFRPLLRRWTEV